MGLQALHTRALARCAPHPAFQEPFMPDRRTTLACAAALAALSFSGLSAAQGK